MKKCLREINTKIVSKKLIEMKVKNRVAEKGFTLFVMGSGVALIRFIFIFTVC